MYLQISRRRAPAHAACGSPPSRQRRAFGSDGRPGGNEPEAVRPATGAGARAQFAATIETRMSAGGAKYGAEVTSRSAPARA
jgi:hypothetical protein